MRKALANLSLCALLAAPLAGAEAPRVVILDMPVEGQEKNVWCWAAVTRMVLQYLQPGRAPEQCEVVTGFLRPDHPGIDCCSPASTKDDKTCATTGLPVLWRVGSEWYRKGNERCGYDEELKTWRGCEPSERIALSWTKLTHEIDHSRPVVLSWRHQEGASHIMVATGYVSQPPDVRWVVINDPWPPHVGSRYLVPHEVFVSGPYEHYWDQWKVGRRIGR